jgi:hypothetical protein
MTISPGHCLLGSQELTNVIYCRLLLWRVEPDGPDSYLLGGVLLPGARHRTHLYRLSHGRVLSQQQCHAHHVS